MKIFFLLTKRFLTFTTSSIFIILLLTLTWQVASRYLLKNPSTITEELSRILLICLAVTGTTLTFIDKKHLAVDILLQRSSPRFQKYLQEFTAVMTILFGIILIIGGFKMIEAKWYLGQTSPVMGFRMVYLYFLLPFAGLIITLSPFGGSEKGN